MKNNQAENIKLYNEVLSEKEIMTIGLIIRKFEREQISYKQLEQLLEVEKVKLTPSLRDVSKLDMSPKQLDEMNKRFKMKDYDPGDFDGYLISGENYKNINIRYDRTMIDILAKNGDEDAIRAREFLIYMDQNKLKVSDVEEKTTKKRC